MQTVSHNKEISLRNDGLALQVSMATTSLLARKRMRMCMVMAG